MFEHFRAHTIVHVKFLARSRVLLGFAVLIALWSAIGLVPAFFLGTTANRFELLKGVAQQLHGTASTITSCLGLAILWSHRRSRTIKMVATKPSSFEGWVASIFVAAGIVGLTVHTVVALLTIVGSWYWAVPYQNGFLYVAADYFVQSVIVLACLTAMSAIVHPVLAVLTLIVFNESTIKFLGIVVAGASDAGARGPVMRAASAVLSGLYYIVPSFSPFEHHTQELYRSLRATTTDWRYLAAAAGYASLICALGYFTTVVVLRRRQLT